MKNLSPITECKDIITKEYMEENSVTGGGVDALDGGSPEAVFTTEQVIDGGDVNGD